MYKLNTSTLNKLPLIHSDSFTISVKIWSRLRGVILVVGKYSTLWILRLSSWSGSIGHCWRSAAGHSTSVPWVNSLSWIEVGNLWRVQLDCQEIRYCACSELWPDAGFQETKLAKPSLCFCRTGRQSEDQIYHCEDAWVLAEVQVTESSPGQLADLLRTEAVISFTKIETESGKGSVTLLIWINVIN